MPGIPVYDKKWMYVCSLEATINVIGGKWKPHILWKKKDARDK